MTMSSEQSAVSSKRRGEKRVSRRVVVFICLLLTVFLHGVSAQAQQPKKIGILASGTPSSMSSRIEAFRQTLRELGYTEGQNVVIEFRYAEANTKRFADLAAKLVALKVDVIVTASGAGALAAQAATRTVPIVFTALGDPVADGLVASLSHPGGNITGLTNLSLDLGGKRLELLKDSFPKVRRVAYLWNPDRPAAELKDMQAAAQAMGVQLQSLEVRSVADFDRAFEIALREQSQALITWTNPLLPLIAVESSISRKKTD